MPKIPKIPKLNARYAILIAGTALGAIMLNNGITGLLAKYSITITPGVAIITGILIPVILIKIL